MKWPELIQPLPFSRETGEYGSRIQHQLSAPSDVPGNGEVYVSVRHRERMVSLLAKRVI